MLEPRLIDCVHLGRERVIGCWQVGDALIDPGPESCLETLLAGVVGTPRRLLLTHIHLDHAGATGALVERFPDIEVWVHERGAPHLADPAKLLASAQRLYGRRMKELWGRVVPVPAENLRPLRGGERLDGGVEVTYTPGHASHHVSYCIDRIAYVGDVAGVRIPPAKLILMPTPPLDIDVEAWQVSIDAVSTWHPRRLALTHYGSVDDVAGHLALARRLLTQGAELARSLERDQYVERLRASVRRVADEETAAVYEQAAPYDQLYAGLKRYWEKRNNPG